MLPEAVDAVLPSLIELRRDIHRNPELGFSEFRTTKRIAEELEKHGLPFHVREAGTGGWLEIGEGDRLDVPVPAGPLVLEWRPSSGETVARTVGGAAGTRVEVVLGGD